MENLQKVKSWKKIQKLSKNFAKKLFKNNSYILRTLLQVVVFVSFFALADRPCLL